MCEPISRNSPPPPPDPPGGGKKHHKDRDSRRGDGGNNEGLTLTSQEFSDSDEDIDVDVEEVFNVYELCSPLNPDEVDELVPGCIFA